jgi:hypothetical protein
MYHRVNVLTHITTTGQLNEKEGKSQREGWSVQRSERSGESEVLPASTTPMPSVIDNMRKSDQG